MNHIRAGRIRAIIGVCAVAVSAIGITAAATTDDAEELVQIDGSQNTFDILATGVYGTDVADWTPAATDWAEGNPTAYRIALGAGQSNSLAPGGELHARIAVKDNSPKLAGHITLTVSDPQPLGKATADGTGTYLELFDQLIFTVRDGSRTIADSVPAADLTTYDLGEALDAGASKVLDVTIAMNPDADNRWQGSSTDVAFRFDGMSN